MRRKQSAKKKQSFGGTRVHLPESNTPALRLTRAAEKEKERERDGV